MGICFTCIHYVIALIWINALILTSLTTTRCIHICSYDIVAFTILFSITRRFLQCLHTLVGCGLSGPTSPLAFAEAVLVAIGQSAASLQNKEQLWRIWSTVVNPLTDTISQVGTCAAPTHYCLNGVKSFCDERLSGAES